MYPPTRLNTPPCFPPSAAPLAPQSQDAIVGPNSDDIWLATSGSIVTWGQEKSTKVTTVDGWNPAPVDR